MHGIVVDPEFTRRRDQMDAAVDQILNSLTQRELDNKKASAQSIARNLLESEALAFSQIGALAATQSQ